MTSNQIQYRSGSEIPFEKIITLYQDANWRIYTARPEKLKAAVDHSIYVMTAWLGDQLVGLIRAVGDGLTIIYVQDILVLKAYQRKGIGSALLRQLLENYHNVRQIVLLTDDTKETIAFYESLGFKQTQKLKIQSFLLLNEHEGV